MLSKTSKKLKVFKLPTQEELNFICSCICKYIDDSVLVNYLYTINFGHEGDPWEIVVKLYMKCNNDNYDFLKEELYHCIRKVEQINSDFYIGKSVVLFDDMKVYYPKIYEEYLSME